MSLGKYPQETANILYYNIFWFFLKDVKNINDSSLDLEKFPVTKSQTACKEDGGFIGHPQIAQINLMRHQCTDLPPSKHKKKQFFKSGPPSHEWYSSQHKQVPPYKKFDPKQVHTSRDRCSNCRDSKHMEGFKCPAKKFQCKTCNKYGYSQTCVTRNRCFFKSSVV